MTIAVESITTKYGTAIVDDNGYYRISSRKEGNFGKRLHRLIAIDYFGDWIDDKENYFEIHHIDGNKLNNCVLNLEPIKHSEHLSIHKMGEKNHFYGKKQSKESNAKRSESMKGKKNALKHYARIIKYGKENNKQIYAIKFKGKSLKQSVYKEKLLNWFLKEHPLEIIKV